MKKPIDIPKLTTHPGATLGQAGDQFRVDWRFHLVTRAASDRRKRDQIWADAKGEDDMRSDVEPSSTAQADAEESQARYDDYDEGGTRGGRE